MTIGIKQVFMAPGDVHPPWADSSYQTKRYKPSPGAQYGLLDLFPADPNLGEIRGKKIEALLISAEDYPHRSRVDGELVVMIPANKTVLVYLGGGWLNASWTTQNACIPRPYEEIETTKTYDFEGHLLSEVFIVPFPCVKYFDQNFDLLASDPEQVTSNPILVGEVLESECPVIQITPFLRW